MLDSPKTPAQAQIRVWDPFVRVFHWTLLAAFTVAYLVEDPHIVHVWSGYVIAGLILARVVWGFAGSRHARFSDFVYRPMTTFAYIRDLLLMRGKRYLGHSPAGGYMILLLLVMLAATGIAGLIVYGGEEQAGPLAGMVSKATAENFEEIHEVLANITLALIVVHVAAVIFASFAHRENLPRAMVTGWKRR
ncbi:cytochrome B [Methyloceanibacter marginalis]|uniref:Cytochrome B n=1 Tax=Methyloceanibacter marginalis TaxID=1774971 RepID=A0A1E3WFF0_9HYPH|nr:cytochrome b/b6 domain-containing protein [Methyloceanibacter marginalis]ODS03757.1 cytochrome B [Methyloceanibacter marginalis]